MAAGATSVIRPTERMPKPKRAKSSGTAVVGSSGEVLSGRALNRALLARQMLLRRERRTALAAVEHLVGMQAQVPDTPYTGLWSRLVGFDPEELSRLMTERRVVRVSVMRGTIHLVSADDCLTLRPLTQPVHDRTFRGNQGRRLQGAAMDAVVAAGRALVEERPRTFAELGARLRERWPDADADALAQAVRTGAALVQVPPRGLWRGGGLAMHTTAEHWLGRPLAANPSVDEMVMRYLAAFGPASVADAQAWCGLTGLREVMDRLRPRLATFRDERGRELFDLPNAPRPDPETPAPPRFLPEYDNALLSHDDRSRIVSDEHRRGLYTANGMTFGTVLLDGYVGATWKITREKSAAVLAIQTFASLSAADEAAVAEEGATLLAFAEGGAETRDVRIDLRTS
ncbi:MAG: hypothetical protein JWM27_4240 [Gemmatimonadetes bacterium]|nr:hypothetical protein [Gemmatimonadota bacterium]